MKAASKHAGRNCFDEQSSDITAVFIVTQFCGICPKRKSIVPRIFNKLQWLGKLGHKEKQKKPL